MKTAWNDRMSPRIVLALALCASACRKDAKQEQEDNSRRLTADSPHDATEPIVDEDWRFELRWPGEGWKLMREQDASQITPGAIAGAVHRDSPNVAVIIEEMPGVSLDTAAEIMRSALPGENIEFDATERVTVAGKEAVRFSASTTLDEARIRYVNIGFLHDDHLFQLQSWGLEHRYPPERLQAVVDAFRLLDGEVTGRASPVKRIDTAGVGWIVEAGAYRSAISGVAIDPPAGWHVAVGEELEQMAPDAELGLVHERPDLYVVVTTEAAPKRRRDSFEAQLREQFVQGAEVGGEPEIIERTVGGTPVKVHRYRSDVLAFEHGVQFRGARALQVSAWYFAGFQQRAEKPLADVFAALSVMEPAVRNALRSELIDRPSPQFASGIGWSVRGSVFRDFGHALTWTAPRGSFWVLEGGEAARSMDARAVLSIEEPERSTFGMIVATDLESADAEQWHTQVEEIVEWPTSERSEVLLSGARTGRMSTATGELASTPVDWLFVTTVEGATGIALVLWGQAPLREGAPTVVAQAIAGLEVHARLPEVTQGEEYVDHRLGFSFAPPPGFTITDKTAEPTRAMGRMLDMTSGRSGATFECVWAAIPGDATWMEALLEQSLRDRFSEVLSSGAPERTQVQVAGRTANKLTWTKGLDRVDGVVFGAGARLFVITTRNTDADVTKALLDSVRVLD
jgi:hypothetical protein